jgi:DNA-binding beta-propeller fold protein YncE
MRFIRRGALLTACAAASLLAQSTPAAEGQRGPDYAVTKSVPLGAPDRWDYVLFDPESHRVYVAHGDRVTVVDGESGALVGQIEGYPGGTHGIAIVPGLGRGFTDDGEAGEAGEFDLKSLKTLKRFKTADDADSIAFDPISGHVFVINGDTGIVTVIDPKSETTVASIQTGEKLEFPVSGRDGKLYVNGAGKGEILRIDVRSNQVDARWPVSNCKSPHGLAIDREARRLFSSCVNNVLVVVNIDSGATVASLPIGAGTDAAAFDSHRKLIFSSNGRDGTLSVIQEKDPQTYVPVATVKTVVSARTMDLDPQSGRIYLVAGDVAPAAGANGKRSIVPGSLRLLFLDPKP